MMRVVAKSTESDSAKSGFLGVDSNVVLDRLLGRHTLLPSTVVRDLTTLILDGAVTEKLRALDAIESSM